MLGVLLCSEAANERCGGDSESGLIHGYVTKPVSDREVRHEVRRAVEFLRLKSERDRLERALLVRAGARDSARVRNAITVQLDTDPLAEFAGRSDSVVRLKDAARSYGQSNMPIFITGETGTGKELLARAIHALSARTEHKFVPINCAAFAAHLVESELFGHRSGAFTGAEREKPGLVDVADQGTLFLDEIGDLPLDIQAKVLRLLQFGTFYPVGSEKEHEVDLRVISATNRPLEDGTIHSLARNGLREDLLYRLNTVHLHIPPLRDRPEDIPVIFERIAERRGAKSLALSPEARHVLCAYSFPGNVRELEHLVDRLFHHSDIHGDSDHPVSASVMEELLQHDPISGCADVQSAAGRTPLSMNQWASPRDGVAFSLPRYVERIEQTLISQALDEHDGNLSRTARALGLSRQGLKNKMRRYGLRT